MDRFVAIASGLSKAFPEGNHPFQIITRLAEECGELAKEVNHWERTGVKVKKYGEPSKERLAGEVKNVITSALQVALYYQIDDELRESIQRSYDRLLEQGWIEK